MLLTPAINSLVQRGHNRRPLRREVLVLTRIGQQIEEFAAPNSPFHDVLPTARSQGELHSTDLDTEGLRPVVETSSEEDGTLVIEGRAPNDRIQKISTGQIARRAVDIQKGQHSREHVDGLNRFVDALVRWDHAPELHDQRNSNGFLVEMDTVVVEAVISQALDMISGHNKECVFVQTMCREAVQQTSEMAVRIGNLRVVAHPKAQRALDRRLAESVGMVGGRGEGGVWIEIVDKKKEGLVAISLVPHPAEDRVGRLIGPPPGPSPALQSGARALAVELRPV